MIDNSTLEKLEFPKVLSYISKYAVTESGKAKILSLKPINDLESILHQGTMVNQAKEVLINGTPPPLEYIPDLSEDLARSKIKTILDPEGDKSEVRRTAAKRKQKGRAGTLLSQGRETLG